MTPKEELEDCLSSLVLMAARAQVLQREGYMYELNNLLNRMERVARQGSYCIFDIADMAG